MSTMLSIKVINKGLSWIDLEVKMAHPNAPNFTEQKAFVLMILAEQAYDFDNSYNYVPNCPLGMAIPSDEVSELDYFESIADEYIEKVIIYETLNFPRGGAEAPVAKYRIWVTDTKWIAHLQPDIYYESAAYGEKPWINENISINLPTPKDAIY